MSLVDNVKKITEETDDDLINVYLTIAGDAILNRLYQFDMDAREETVPARYESLQTQIAVYLINKAGAEGEIVHNENGISRQYENADVPESMLKFVTPKVKVV